MNSSKTAPSSAKGLGWLRAFSGQRRDALGPWREQIQRTILDPEKKVLWLVGNLSTARQFLIEEHRASATILASSVAIASALSGLAKGNVRIAVADFETAPIAEDHDLCIACPAPDQIADAYEGWLEGPIARALKPGGVAIIPWPAAELSSAGTVDDRDAPLRTFRAHHFTAERPSLADAFARSSLFELEGSEDLGKEAEVWLRLIRRASPLSKAEPAFTRSAREDRFPMADFATFARRLRRSDIKVVRTAEFAERFATYVPDAEQAEGYGVLKFDIHRGIKRAEEMARILANASLPGLFLMMHRHDANASFFDHPETWSILRSIEKMGHEVGLHIDPFDLVRRHGDLLAGVAAAANELREKGLSVESATLHGDTRATIRARKLRALDFFEDGKHVSAWDGIAPVGDEQLVEHFGLYSLHELQARSGIRYLAETTFGNAGTMIRPFVPLYISDNTRVLRTSGGRKQRVRGDRPFRISYVLARRIAGQMRQRPFLALFHPQWYW